MMSMMILLMMIVSHEECVSTTGPSRWTLFNDLRGLVGSSVLDSDRVRKDYSFVSVSLRCTERVPVCRSRVVSTQV